MLLLNSLIVLGPCEPAFPRFGLRSLQHQLKLFIWCKVRCSGLFVLHSGYASRVQQVQVILHQIIKKDRSSCNAMLLSLSRYVHPFCN